MALAPGPQKKRCESYGTVVSYVALTNYNILGSGLLIWYQ